MIFFFLIFLSIAVVFFGKPIYFVKNSFQQRSSVLVRKKNIKPKLSNPKPFCITLKTSVFSGFFMKTWCFCGKIITSQTPLLLGLCSQLAWYSFAVGVFAALPQYGIPKGYKGACLVLKIHTGDFTVDASQPFFFSLHLGREAWDVKSSSGNFPWHKIMMGKKASDKSTMYKNNLSKAESWIALGIGDWSPHHPQVILLLLLVHVWNIS